MSELGRLLDLLLPGLICLCPMGAIAYYNSKSEDKAQHPDAVSARQRAHVPGAMRGPVVVQPAQL